MIGPRTKKKARIGLFGIGLAAEGESIPGDILLIGNTNSRLKFGIDSIDFMNAWCQEGPTHHCALGVGHVLPKIKKLSRLLGVELKVIG